MLRGASSTVIKNSTSRQSIRRFIRITGNLLRLALVRAIRGHTYNLLDDRVGATKSPPTA